MGGDGGVIASNRKYMRGAGTADHTADASRRGDQVLHDKDVLRTCRVTQSPLNLKHPIVACPYGRLYQKEAAVEALLRRQNQKKSDALGTHIRGLKDLYPVRFHLSQDDSPICPVTGVELNDKHPCFLITSKKSRSENGPNVLGERAMKEVGMEAIQAEYGPFDDSKDVLRLAPTANILHDSQGKLKIRRETEKSSKKSKKDGKKRNSLEGDVIVSTKRPKSSQGSGVAEAARARVATAVASNEVLSSLFVTSSGVSEKEKNDNLFART